MFQAPVERMSCALKLCSMFKTQCLPLHNVLICFVVIFLDIFFLEVNYSSIFNSYPTFPVFSFNYSRYSDTVSWGEYDDYFMKFWSTIFTTQITLFWFFFYTWSMDRFKFYSKAPTACYKDRNLFVLPETKFLFLSSEGRLKKKKSQENSLSHGKSVE